MSDSFSAKFLSIKSLCECWIGTRTDMPVSVQPKGTLSIFNTNMIAAGFSFFTLSVYHVKNVPFCSMLVCYFIMGGHWVLSSKFLTSVPIIMCLLLSLITSYILICLLFNSLSSLLCVCVCLLVGLRTECSSYGGQKRVPDSLGPEIEADEPPSVGAENWSWVLGESSACF